MMRGGLEGEMPKGSEYKREEVENYEILEKFPLPNKEIVLALIDDLAKREGFRLVDLELCKETYGSDGSLLVIEVQLKNKAAKNYGWGRIVFEYRVAGKIEKKYFGGATWITRCCSTVNDIGSAAQAGIIGEYIGGQWKLNPGDNLPIVTLIDSDEDDDS